MSFEKNIKIIIVDDNVQFRKNLKNYIESELNCIVISEASNGIEFLKLTNIHEADIILMDIAMEKMDGFEATKTAFWNNPHIRVIAVTMHNEKVFLTKLLETGFKACVFKSEIYAQLNPAMEQVLKGRLFVPPHIQIDENKSYGLDNTKI